MTADDVRARFEEAMSRVGYLFTRDGDGYMEPSMTFAWIGYRAANADRDAEVREFLQDCAANANGVHIPDQRSRRALDLIAKLTQEKP